MARTPIQFYPSPKSERLIRAYAHDEEKSISEVCKEMAEFFWEKHPELKRRCESLIEKK